MADDPNENVALAFGLTIAAGLSTGIGAGMVFLSGWVKLTEPTFLGGALALSAGVMLYVSFIEIFQKSVMGFTDAGYADNEAYGAGTLCFFAGIAFITIIDIIVHRLDSQGHHGHGHGTNPNMEQGIQKLDVESLAVSHSSPVFVRVDSPDDKDDHVKEESKLDEVKVTLVNDVEVKEHKSRSNSSDQNNQKDNEGEEEGLKEHKHDGEESGQIAVSEVGVPMPVVEEEKEHEQKKLVRMGLMTALAIGIHNFPEGLATFLATLDDPNVGAALAVAIAIHNVPEGLCVSIPVFYATKSRTKAFMWALLSGVSEPIGALIGWLALRSHMSHRMYGILFGMVGGMMVYICIHELLPTAYRYDPENKFVTKMTILGFAIMALSLVLFTL